MTKFDFNWKLIAMVTIPLAIIMLVFENKQNSKFDLQEKVYKILSDEIKEFIHSLQILIT